MFLELFERTELYDDATRFSFVDAIVSWAVPRNKRGSSFIRLIQTKLSDIGSPFDWLCQVFFLAKYGEPAEVMHAVLQSAKYKAKEPFFARQRVAVLPRVLAADRKAVLSKWTTETSTGASDSASVANNLLNIYRAHFPRKSDRLYYYLFPQKVQRPYPLAKFLLLCVVAHSESRKGQKIQRPEVKAHVNDPWFLHWLTQIHRVLSANVRNAVCGSR